MIKIKIKQINSFDYKKISHEITLQEQNFIRLLVIIVVFKVTLHLKELIISWLKQIEI